MPATNSPLDRINHIVVLMLENRSFDNVLGWLYDSNNKPLRGQQFEAWRERTCRILDPYRRMEIMCQ